MVKPSPVQSRYGVAAVVFVFALLLIMTIGAFAFLQAEQAAHRATDTALEAKTALLDFQQTLLDAETGQRGYLLTRNESYLRPYDLARNRLPAYMHRLSDSLGQDAHGREAYADLADLAGEKMAELSTTLALFREGNRDAAVNIVRSDFGRDTMDMIRDEIAPLIVATEGRIKEADARLSEYALELRITLVVAAVLLFITATTTIWYLLRVLAEATAGADALRHANEQIVQQTRQREEAETQLRQIQKMESLGQLAGGLAHDLNNMLSVIIGNLGLFKRRYSRGEQNLARYLESAEEAASNAATLTQRMLAFSRRQSLSPDYLDVNRFVSSTSELLRHALGSLVRLETVLAGGLWPVFVDANQLENALLNLAINARDAIPLGGRLTIETANAHLDEAYAAANPDSRPGQYVLIAITDTGTGMTPETLARAFDPFFTTKGVGQGTGLGLSQVYGFVKQSNGHVKIYSELGEGTTIKVYLPRYHGPEAESAGQSVTAPLPMGDTRTLVLLVDDEDMVREVTAEGLRELGYAVIEAADGKQALTVLEERPNVTLLLTDVMMPEMNGRQLADEACRRCPDLKVLFATGYTRNAVVHNGIIDPGVQLLPKPFTLAQLAAKLREVLAAA
jgi:signal transduction histidine kinase